MYGSVQPRFHCWLSEPNETLAVTGSDYFIKNKKSISPDELETKVLNINGLTNAFRKAMQDIKAKEKENGDYDIEWAAMNQ
jgi:hypothetical protein